MATIPTPHDSLFKSFMTTPETARDFLEIHLPETLRKQCDFDTLKLESSSFIEDSLRPYISDVLYSMKTRKGVGYVYALVEHQSRSDAKMAFRMLRYAVAAMQQHLEAGNNELPLVIPILFYHGRETPYPYSTNWLDLFKDRELAQALYFQDFPLVDLTVMSDDTIMQHKRVALLELVQKHIRERDVREILEKLVSLLLKGYTTDKQVRALMEYLLRVGETEDFRALVNDLAQKVPEHEETLMTIAEQLKQEGRIEGERQGLLRGRQQGLEEGLQQGLKEGLKEGLQQGKYATQKEMAKKMLASGADVDFILNITGLSLAELNQLKN
ncbi:Rpn family recombination-promoting nuclease/putative transposase (plasmid) [Photobacterium damselae subsp. damselae]|uniref:Rpn family recombination-promoting nuclease/putative transposase n=1 Tax=Photobacterium damselae TaxID=38293 RepID=UPI000A2FC120|nr:Rpn family recombination-promoting nuclease/putative transposase [Photobacterium damselae]ARR51825.1 ISNCY family transposase [Photobacterium damselae subsp. damselae]QAY37681.1 Rpn family recombination-promoting nuclease/putative transposase [Photobacterium damselae subsp. damselae]